MRYTFIREHRVRFRVEVMCDVLEVAAAGFYAWLLRPQSERDKRAAELTEQIRVVHHDSYDTYGALKVTKELRSQGHKVNRKTVARLMAQAGIYSKVVKPFRICTTDSNHDNPVAPNTLNREFAVDKPNKVWGADITYIHTDEGVLYLAGIMDLYSRRIVGWSMDDTMTTQLVEDAFTMAVTSRAPSKDLLHHSDRGSQYASQRYRELLDMHGTQASMSRTGNCYDNAVVESFWGKLKTEWVYHARYATKAQARAAVFEYIEVWYNRKRRHAALGYVSPEEFEATNR